MQTTGLLLVQVKASAEWHIAWLSTKLIGGYTGITLSVRPSVCPSVDRIVSALYLQEYSSDPFHICTSYQATSEGVSRVMPISKFKNLIQYDSMVWVIMRRRGVSSERRRSSCSSWYRHCGETVTIIAVTTIQDGGRRRRLVRAGSDCDSCMPRRHT